MIWVSWRQHRIQAIACLGLLAVLAVYAILVSTSMRSAFSQDGLAACIAHGTRTGGCQAEIISFMNRFNFLVNGTADVLLFMMPGLIGVLIGGPLIGRELETGTWRLAWSQTVPRTRWLAVKLILVAGGLLLLGAAMTALITWYRQPMDRLTGSFSDSAAFDYEGLTLTAYLLCAFALALLAGLLLRRNLPAMVAAFVTWLAIRSIVEFGLRAHFQAPVTLRVTAAPNTPYTMGPDVVPPQTGHIGDWVLSVNRVGAQIVTVYQPADRFWDFQLIEAGAFVALTAAALGATIWLLHRRAA
jgi:hypothetical protein